jgi:ankyrin repeat protein
VKKIERGLCIFCILFFVISGIESSRAQQNDDTDPPLWIAVQAHYYSIAKNLLDDGADPNAHSPSHESPLFVAVDADDTTMVTLLLDHHANMYDSAPSGHLIGEVAAISNSLHSLEILYRHGYPLTMRNRQNQSLLSTAVGQDSYRIVEYILQHGGNVNDTDGFGYSLLMEAASMDITGNGDTAMVSLLLRAGADPNKPDAKSFYPIYDAVSSIENVPRFVSEISDKGVPYKDSSTFIMRQNTHQRVVELLLKAGANPNVEDHPGGNPLWLAVKNCDAATVKLLLQYGASEKALSAKGQYVLEKAKKNACGAVLQLLK